MKVATDSLKQQLRVLTIPVFIEMALVMMMGAVYPVIVRCHRAFLVNISQVEQIISHEGTMQQPLSRGPLSGFQTIC